MPGYSIAGSDAHAGGNSPWATQRRSGAALRTRWRKTCSQQTNKICLTEKETQATTCDNHTRFRKMRLRFYGQVENLSQNTRLPKSPTCEGPEWDKNRAKVMKVDVRPCIWAHGFCGRLNEKGCASRASHKQKVEGKNLLAFKRKVLNTWLPKCCSKSRLVLSLALPFSASHLFIFFSICRLLLLYFLACFCASATSLHCTCPAVFPSWQCNGRMANKTIPKLFAICCSCTENIWLNSGRGAKHNPMMFEQKAKVFCSHAQHTCMHCLRMVRQSVYPYISGSVHAWM